MTNIHPLAVVSEKANIGENIKVGPFCYVGDNVELGDDCILETNVRIEGVTKIGSGNRFFHSAVIGSPCQDLKYKGEPTKLIIGNNNVFREFVTVNCASTLDDDTVIGDNCFLMAYCHIAHDCHLGNNIIMANVATLAGHITIGDNVIVGGLTAVHQFVKIGEYSFIGGLSGVKKDVPPYVRGEGMPFRPIGLNSIGLKRRGFDEETIKSIKRIYKLFYESGLNTSQALQKTSALTGLTNEQNRFIDFIKESERGISK